MRRILAHQSGFPLVLIALFLTSLAIATHIEGKSLWVAYNLVGATLALALAVLFTRCEFHLSPVPALIAFATAMLHYVGGSLGGHFGVEGINGLYATFPWYDRIVHFAGAAGIAALAFSVTTQRAVANAWRVPPGFLALFAFTLTVSVGVGVELFEFGAWSFFGTIDQGFYSNTLMDLWSDVTGAAFGSALAHAVTVRARHTPIEPATNVPA